MIYFYIIILYIICNCCTCYLTESSKNVMPILFHTSVLPFRLRLCNFHIYIDTTLCRKTFLKLSKACRTWNERFDVISISQRESENLHRFVAIWHGILFELAPRKIGHWAIYAWINDSPRSRPSTADASADAAKFAHIIASMSIFILS